MTRALVEETIIVGQTHFPLFDEYLEEGNSVSH